MRLALDSEFIEICEQIIEEALSAEQWAEIESDDMFRTGKYAGGFDATEMAFCFSANLSDSEIWFQLTLEEIDSALQGRITSVDARVAD